MRKLLPLFVCGFLSVGMCRVASAQNCKTDPKDKAALVQTIRTMYEAATVDDFAKLHTVVAPVFYAFDDGLRYDSMDSLMNAVKALQDRGVKFVWNVTKPEVTVECDRAWITYLNDGSIQMPGAMAAVPTQWLESAILKKRDGAWKLVFFGGRKLQRYEKTYVVWMRGTHAVPVWASRCAGWGGDDHSRGCGGAESSCVDSDSERRSERV